MKKLISVSSLIAVLLCLVSCGGGKSVPTDFLTSNNRIGAIITKGTLSYTEKIEYFTGDALSYTVYTEAANGFAYTYNIAEKIGDYTLYIHEGNIFAEKDGTICTVILSNPAYTFANYVSNYLNADFPLDAGVRYQRSSSVDGEYTYVTYYAEVTPQMASSIYSAKLHTGEKIISSYKLGAGYRIYQIDYSVENADGTKEIARRTFEYFDKRSEDIFSAIPSAETPVNTLTLIYANNTVTHSVYDGTYIDFEDGGAGYRYFTDADMNSEYVASPSEDMTLYVKTNFD